MVLSGKNLSDRTIAQGDMKCAERVEPGKTGQPGRLQITGGY